MPRLIITEGGAAGIERCRRFLADRNPAAARHAAIAIATRLSQLEANPAIGRPLPGPNEFRELIIPFGVAGYVALYRADHDADDVLLLAFRHQREAGY